VGMETRCTILPISTVTSAHQVPPHNHAAIQHMKRIYCGIGTVFDERVATYSRDNKEDIQQQEANEDNATLVGEERQFSLNDSWTEDQEGLFRRNVIPVGIPIIESFNRAKTSYSTTPLYSYNEQTAPEHRQTVITYEEMSGTEAKPPDLQPEPLESKKIESLISFSKATKGIMWHNRTSAKLHYEMTIEDFKTCIQQPAQLKGIKHSIFMETTKVDQCVKSGDNVTIIAIRKDLNFIRKYVSRKS
jgi:hypothetical protein